MSEVFIVAMTGAMVLFAPLVTNRSVRNESVLCPSFWALTILLAMSMFGYIFTNDFPVVSGP